MGDISAFKQTLKDRVAQELKDVSPEIESLKEMLAPKLKEVLGPNLKEGLAQQMEGLALQEEPGRFDGLVEAIADAVAGVIPEPGGAIVGSLLEVLLPFIFEWSLGLLLDL